MLFFLNFHKVHKLVCDCVCCSIFGLVLSVCGFIYILCFRTIIKTNLISLEKLILTTKKRLYNYFIYIRVFFRAFLQPDNGGKISIFYKAKIISWLLNILLNSQVKPLLGSKLCDHRIVRSWRVVAILFLLFLYQKIKIDECQLATCVGHTPSQSIFRSKFHS